MHLELDHSQAHRDSAAVDGVLRRDPRRLVMHISLAMSGVMLTGKLTAYFLTNSVAFLADAAESVVHGVATALAAFSLWYASQPPDARHPYGHGRIAYFSAGFEGALVAAAAITVIWQGVKGLITPPELARLDLGLAISTVLMAINLVLGLALVRIGRRYHSIVLEGNGRHVLSDVWTTAAAIIGVGLVWLTGVHWPDPVAAVVLGAYIFYSGSSLIRSSFGGLMDEVDPALVHDIVDELQQGVAAGTIVAYHQLRCRQVNDQIWIELHMLVPGGISIEEAHRRVTRVEDALKARLGRERARVTTHIEPRDHESAHPGGHRPDSDPLST